MFLGVPLYSEETFQHSLESFIQKGMKKYKMEPVILTNINMIRRNLITQENMVDYCNGKRDEKNSINDDLELLFDLNVFHPYFLQTMEDVQTYFLPRLTEEELELVERRNTSYLRTFFSGNPAVDETGTMLSESDSKYVLGRSRRKTFGIENSSQMLAENSSETSSE